MRKETGMYIIQFYDELGSKTGKSSSFSYLEAMGMGEKHLATHHEHSFVISRVLFNSAIRCDKWDYR